jgi:hypothetical protein
VREAIEAHKAELINQYGLSGSEAETVAEDDILSQLRSGGRADFAEGYTARKAAQAAAGAGSSQSTRSSEGLTTSASRSSSANYGQRLEDRYPGFTAAFPLYTPEEQQALLSSLQPEDRAALIGQLQTARAQAAKATPTAPTMEMPDLITRSREIAAGRFGPTYASPAYARRNALQSLLGLSPEEVAKLNTAYPESSTVQQPAPPAQQLPPPAQQPAPPVTPVQHRVLPTPLQQAIDASAFNRSNATPPPLGLENRTVDLNPQAGTMVMPTTPHLEGRWPTAGVPGPRGRPPDSRLPFPPPEPPPAASTPVGPADVREVVRPSGPFAGQNQATIRAGVEALGHQAEREAAERKRKEDEAAVKGAGILGYYGSRVNAAMALKDQPDRLRRLTASGAGRVGYQIYAANKAKGVPFPTTYAEITNTFAGDPEAMRKAHEVAMAAAFAAHDAINPKEV